MNYCKDIYLLELTNHMNDSGQLSSIDFMNDLNSDIKRSFIVSTLKENVVRGRHAHRELNQFIVCVNGKSRILCDDGEIKKTFILDSPNKVLYVPSQIWSEQEYIMRDTTLMVLCDDIYKENDYIRNYSDFLLFRKTLR